MHGQLLELQEKLTSFVALASFCISLCQQGHHHRIIGYFSRFLVLGHCFGQLSF